MDELIEYLQEAHSDGKVVLKELEKRLQYHNQHHKPARSVQVGDLVVLRNVDTTAGVNKKFIPKYRGPYVVRKQLSNDRYEMIDVENCQITQIRYKNIVDSTHLKK